VRAVSYEARRTSRSANYRWCYIETNVDYFKAGACTAKSRDEFIINALALRCFDERIDCLTDSNTEKRLAISARNVHCLPIVGILHGRPMTERPVVLPAVRGMPMAHGLPTHIVHEIERRWQRRLDWRPPEKPGKSTDHGAGRCPRCGATA